MNSFQEKRLKEGPKGEIILNLSKFMKDQLLIWAFRDHQFHGPPIQINPLFHWIISDLVFFTGCNSRLVYRLINQTTFKF